MRKYIKPTLLQLILLLLCFPLLGVVYAAWNDDVSTGDPLSADSWNDIVERVEVFNINNGNVGIGTSSPSANLELANNLPGLNIKDLDGEKDIGGQHGIIQFLDKDDSVYGLMGYHTIDQSMRFSNRNASGSINFDVTGSGATPAGVHDVIITSDGDVGIGTTTPSQSLQVIGNIIGGNTISSDLDDTFKRNHILFSRTGKGIRPIGSKGFRINSVGDGSGDMVNLSTAYYDGSTLTTIQTYLPNGDIGIGTTSPSTKLHVAGTITEDSDERLKTNITPVENSLEKIMKIEGVSFDWKDIKKYGEQRTYGVLAQDIEEVFPELVYTSDDEFGIKSVNYDGLVAPFIEAMKQQQKIIELQQDKLEAQEIQTQTQQQQIQELYSEIELLKTK